MHEQVAKPNDKFYFKEKYCFPVFHEHKNTKLNHFLPISKVVKQLQQFVKTHLANL